MIITKLLSHQRAKPIMAVIAIILLFIIYKIYSWANTQSTDNAYIEADIYSVSAEVGGVIDEVCQYAFKNDPPCALKIDPPAAWI